MGRKQVSIRQKITTRPIEIYMEFRDLSESDFEHVRKITQIYTDACEARFIDLLKKAINRYCETGEVPTLGLAMEEFDNGK